MVTLPDRVPRGLALYCGVLSKLLVIDDDHADCRLVAAAFERDGWAVTAAHDAASGLARAISMSPDVVLLDLKLPDRDGLDLLEQLLRDVPGVPVIMMTAWRDVKTAVRALQLGAFDYLSKPVDMDELVVVVRRAHRNRTLQSEVDELRSRLARDEAESLMAQMGPSPQTTEVLAQVGLVAASDFCVLIQGETGAGKELVAEGIHRQSHRRAHPFVALDCGAIPEALLESELFGHERGAFTGADRRQGGQFLQADGGTCFLDEVGNLPLSLQAKLLRVLESKQVRPLGAQRSLPIDVRFLAATNHDLPARVREGLFRADLYFRLAQYTVTLPPLRKRKADIPHLAIRFLQEAAIELRRPVLAFGPGALDGLLTYSWPGNVRELRNVVRQAVLESRDDLEVSRERLAAVLKRPAGFENPGDPAVLATGSQSLRQIADDAARRAERLAICEVLQSTGGNKSRAARVLRTDYKTLHLKMRHLGIRASDFRA